eukprot:1160938-Pelagomonas_calceolata.AAC.23
MQAHLAQAQLHLNVQWGIAASVTSLDASTIQYKLGGPSQVVCCGTEVQGCHAWADTECN